MTKIKICGITTQDTLDAAATAGADFIGFVFYPPSPRAITPTQVAPLIESLPSHVKSVALFVNPTDEDLEMTLRESPTDYIQLHANEDPNRVKQIKDRYGKPIIKAIGIATAADLEKAHAYEDTTDWLLFDYKPPSSIIHHPSSTLPGGTGQSFDWSLLENKKFKKPWMLSGGLTEDNVKQAIATLNPPAIDVSSGVESTRGIKSVSKIKNFIKETKSNG